MSNQLVKKNPAEGYQNVFPKTFIDAIKDKESGVSLQEILQGFNMYFLSYNGSRALTRCKIPTVLRKEGLWITYVLYDHTVVTEWYNSDQIDDNSWGADDNWRIASNNLVGDVSVSADGYWVIDGKKTSAKAQGESGITPLIRIGANNKLQVSYNNGKGWKDISNSFTNNFKISRYIGINDELPTTGIAEGTIYMKGPYYDENDALNENPIYRMWVYAWNGGVLAWQDNGEFTSISAGVVQELGESETEIMSQKAVTNNISNTYLFNFISAGTSIDCFEDYSYALLLGNKVKRLMHDSSWDNTGDTVSVCIPVIPILKTLVYVSKSSGFEMAFLKSYSEDSAEFCDGTTIETPTIYTVKEYSIPEDCNYIYLSLYRGGTYLLHSLSLYSSKSYYDSKTRANSINNGILDLSLYPKYLAGGSLPSVYPTSSRCLIYIPAANVEYYTITPKEGWRVASYYCKDTIVNPYSFYSKAEPTYSLTGVVSGAHVTYGESVTYTVPDSAKTIELWIKREDDGVINLDDIPSAFEFSVQTKDSINKKRSRYAKLSILDAPTSCIRWNTAENKLHFPSSTVIWYGDNAKERFGYYGNFSINVPSEGGHNKLVFNPTKENISEKIYILYGEQQENEYHLCDIHLGIHSLSLPTEYYIVDGKHPSTSTPSQNNSIIYYDGNKIEFPLENKNVLSCVKIGINSLRNDIVWDGSIQYMQGGAVYGNYLFKIGSSGGTTSVCQVYDISNILNPVHTNTYYLGFTGEAAHANCCQFGLEVNDTGFPYLYTRNGGEHACCVEKVSLEGSELVQTIKINIGSVFPHEGGEGNAIIGDDGYLWYFGEANGYQYFAKLRLPAISEGDITLTEVDVLDSWEIKVNDDYINRTWQGGKVKGNRIYFLYGGSATNRLYVVNTSTHMLENIIPLSTIYEEVEDLDFYRGSLLVFLSSHTNGMYKINNIQ